jgi:predicted RNase H-like HicB family nuclease
MKKRELKVVFEPDEDGWLATIPEVQGCLTWGKTIPTARANIREALAACDETYKDAAAVERAVILVDSFKLPPRATKLLEETRAARVVLEAHQKKLAATTAAAARALTKDAGISLRDAGELLELSQERVRQVVKG